MKAHEPLGERVPSQFVAKNNRAAGSTHKEDVYGGYRSQPKMHLEEDVAYEYFLRVFEPYVPKTDRPFLVFNHFSDLNL